jgi:flagellar hook-length control protein FliK
VGEPEQVDTQKPDLDAQMAQKIQQALQQGAQRVEIRLTPENLGSLTIQMTRNVDGSLQVVLHTANDKAMSLLSQHAEQMTVLLQGNGQQVQLEVRQNGESQQAQQDNQQQQQQADPDGRNQNQQRQPKEQQHHSSQDFIQQMRLGLISTQEGV